ncbi:MAG: hypothetical protein LDL07_09980 [Desulfarculus sp.]|nr:hypothetical protein [Desulfarculus sp.]
MGAKRQPSRSWRRQALALRLVGVVVEHVPLAYQRAGHDMPAPVAEAIDAIGRQVAYLWGRIGTEDEVLGPSRPRHTIWHHLEGNSARRQFVAQAEAMKAALAKNWAGDTVSAPALVNSALLVAEELTRQAPDDGRREAWANITWCLNDLLTRHGWDGEEHIPLGATAGEDFRAALWG